MVCGWGLARGGGQFSFQESENEGEGEGGLDISCGVWNKSFLNRPGVVGGATL